MITTSPASTYRAHLDMTASNMLSRSTFVKWEFPWRWNRGLALLRSAPTLYCVWGGKLYSSTLPWYTPSRGYQNRLNQVHGQPKLQWTTVFYQLMLADKGPSTVFVPMAFESWGVFDSQVDDFLEDLVATQDHTVRAWEIDRVDEMRVAIAVAIQEGNFLMWDNSRPLRGGRAPQSA